MSGDVDNVIGAAHHVDVVVVVLEASVRGFIVTGEIGEVRLLEPIRPPATE